MKDLLSFDLFTFQIIFLYFLFLFLTFNVSLPLLTIKPKLSNYYLTIKALKKTTYQVLKILYLQNQLLTLTYEPLVF
jgi:hypothetical protein